MAAGGGRHYQPPPRVGLRDKVEGVLRSAAQRAVRFAYTAPIVRGIGGLPSWYFRPKDAKAESILRSREALGGRTTANLGPVNSYISTYPGSGLTPERIAAIHNEVLVSGYMLNKACLDEQILLRDAHLEAVDKSRRVDLTSCDLSIEPRDDTDLAHQLADYTESWLRDVDRFTPAMYELGFANAAGYALQESIFDEDKEVTFSTKVGGKDQHVTIAGPHPRQLEWVSNKHTCFNPGSEEIFLDLGNFKVASMPAHKFITHVCAKNFQIRRGGYMYQAVWLHLLKHMAMARWGVVLDIWGIPVPVGKLDQALWQDETRKAESRAMLRDAGRGNPFLTTDDFTIEKAFELVSGDARGMHAALIGWANQELSKLVQGETLTTELGGVGGYNTSQTHADTKEAFVRMDEEGLSDSMRSWIRAVNALNVNALARAFGAKPADILRLTPVPHWRIERAVTPQIGLDMIDKAVNNLGLPIAQGPVMRQYGFPRARTDKDRIKGKTEIIPDGATSANTVDAGQSVTGGAPGEAGKPGTGAGGAPKNLELTPSAQGAILKVNEAREFYGLEPMEGGDITISEAVSKQMSAQAPNTSNQEKKPNGDSL